MCLGYMMIWLYLVVYEYPYKQKKPSEKRIFPLSKGSLISDFNVYTNFGILPKA